jgi:hypothetical protein
VTADKEMSRALFHSFTLHGLLALLSLAVIFWLSGGPRSRRTVKIVVNEITKPRMEAQPVVQVTKPKPVAPPARQVFGISRDSNTSEKGAVEVKAGNTLAKAIDQEKLRPRG